MFLTDNHLHSEFSDDSTYSMTEMALATANLGIKQICFTDHFEECAAADGVSYDCSPFTQWEKRADEVRKAQTAVGDSMEILIGAEISAINHDPQSAKTIYSDHGLDFVIGSVHNLLRHEDFYFEKFPQDRSACQEMIRRYAEETLEMVRVGYCDVIGHIGYIQRYMRRQGIDTDIMECEDIFRQVFCEAIPKGIGIEINTSEMRDKGCSFLPDIRILNLYKECGGQIVTVGSDGHTPEYAGFEIRTAYEALKAAGFKYVTQFHQHKPNFISLD